MKILVINRSTQSTGTTSNLAIRTTMNGSVYTLQSLVLVRLDSHRTNYTRVNTDEFGDRLVLLSLALILTYFNTTFERFTNPSCWHWNDEDDRKG